MCRSDESRTDALALVMTTVDSSQEAESLAKSLVEQSLAACVQIDGPIESYYRWAGKIEHASEYRLMIKTTQAAWHTVRDKLAKLHSYDEPEIVMLPIGDASHGYHGWVVEQTT